MQNKYILCSVFVFFFIHFGLIWYFLFLQKLGPSNRDCILFTYNSPLFSDNGDVSMMWVSFQCPSLTVCFTVWHSLLLAVFGTLARVFHRGGGTGWWADGLQWVTLFCILKYCCGWIRLPSIWLLSNVVGCLQLNSTING